IHVDAGHLPADPESGPKADEQSEKKDQHDQLRVVPAHLQIAATEGLEDGDLVALGGDQPVDDDVEQKGGHPEKNGGKNGRHVGELLQLHAEIAMGDLILPVDGPQAAVGVEKLIEALDDIAGAGFGTDGQHQVVEGPFHVGGVGQRGAVHPEYAVAFEIGEKILRPDLIDEFRRQADADDLQSLAPAVDDGAELVSRRKVVGLGKSLADHHLVVAV